MAWLDLREDIGALFCEHSERTAEALETAAYGAYLSALAARRRAPRERLSLEDKRARRRAYKTARRARAAAEREAMGIRDTQRRLRHHGPGLLRPIERDRLAVLERARAILAREAALCRFVQATRPGARAR